MEMVDTLCWYQLGLLKPSGQVWRNSFHILLGSRNRFLKKNLGFKLHYSLRNHRDHGCRPKRAYRTPL